MLTVSFTNSFRVSRRVFSIALQTTLPLRLIAPMTGTLPDISPRSYGTSSIRAGSCPCRRHRSRPLQPRPSACPPVPQVSTFCFNFLPRTGGEGRRGGAPERVLCQRACFRRAIMSSDDEPLRDQGWRLRAECADEERKLWAHLRAKRFAGFQIQPAATTLVHTSQISAASRATGLSNSTAINMPSRSARMP